MVDLKALAVVMVSIAAVGLTTSGGVDLNSFNGFNTPRVPSSVGAFAGMVTNPEPDRDLQANVTVDLDSVELRGESRQLQVQGLKEVELGDSTLSSDSDLVFLNFDGTVSSENQTEISGRTQAVRGETFSINRSVTLRRTIDTERVALQDVNKMRLVFENAQGRINSESISTELSEETEMDVPAFSGNITVDTRNSRVVLDGKASSLNAGELSFN